MEPTPAASLWRGRLALLAGIILIGLNARIMVAVVSPIISIIIEELPLTHGHQELIGWAAPAVFAIMGILAPPLGRRYGLEAMMVVCLGISALGEIARALATTPNQFIWWTIPALAGAGIGNVLVPPLIRKYFPDQVPVVTSIYTLFAMISAALPPLFILNIAQATGWRFSVGVWGAAGLLGFLPWMVIIFSSSRSGHRISAIKRRLDPRTVVERPPRLGVPIWKTKVAWAMTTVFVVNSLIAYTMFAWLPHVLTEAGISQTSAAMYLAIFAIAPLPGAFITPILAARLKHGWILPVVFSVAYAISMTFLAFWPAFLTLAWILLSRIGDSFFPYIMTMINLRTRTTHGSMAMSGFVQFFGYSLASIGPIGFGILYTATGTWQVPMTAILVLLPIQFVAGMIVARAVPVDV
ncbi:MAG: MFS transporter [Propionibacteriaceae bacterium]|jgi:CP family cyanate transporter-like MFS transporter|nr:MFS transporter [Propionibacteriaceae bacterium]